MCIDTHLSSWFCLCLEFRDVNNYRQFICVDPLPQQCVGVDVPLVHTHTHTRGCLCDTYDQRIISCVCQQIEVQIMKNVRIQSLRSISRHTWIVHIHTILMNEQCRHVEEDWVWHHSRRTCSHSPTVENFQTASYLSYLSYIFHALHTTRL